MKKPKSLPAEAGAKRAFLSTSRIDHNGESYDAGDQIVLTKDQFEELKAVDAITGDWADEAEPQE